MTQLGSGEFVTSVLAHDGRKTRLIGHDVGRLDQWSIHVGLPASAEAKIYQ